MKTGVGEQRKDGIGLASNLINKKKTKKNKKKDDRCRYMITKRPASPAVPETLQRLFLSCRDVFKGPGTVPNYTDVHKLCHILDRMMPEHVGLSRDLQFFEPKGAGKRSPRVAYTTIYRSRDFSLCIFFLPATAVIPLHNHPEMTVFSKLLWGTMHIKAYDWVDPSNAESVSSSEWKLAKLKANKVFKAPCNTSVLYPTSGGNIHAFTAITPCAVLDVLGPPYSKEDGRDCSYYKDEPYNALANGEAIVRLGREEIDCYGWLKEIEMPEESEMDIIEYLGPQVTEA